MRIVVRSAGLVGLPLPRQPCQQEKRNSKNHATRPVGPTVQAPRGEDQARSPLQVTMHLKITSRRIIDPITKRLQILYALPVLIPALSVIAIAHYWLYFVYDMAASVRAVLYMPGGLLLTLGLVLVLGVFHEFGHAAALRYGGDKVRGNGRRPLPNLPPPSIAM